MANPDHLKLLISSIKSQNEQENPRSVNLEGLDLRGADLSGLTFYKVNLIRCNLKGVALFHTTGNNKQIKNIPLITECNPFCWDIVYTKTDLQVGCRSYPIEQWEKFNDRVITSMHPEALKFWKYNKEYILDYIKENPAID